MLSAETLESARRQLEICNACRYCEGVCAVFPALERRAAFAEGDVAFLANLCHDCQTCFAVCPFAPPHAFEVNIPALMSGVRRSTYRRYAWPSTLGMLLERHRRAVGLVAAVSFTIALAAALAAAGTDGFLSAHAGPGAFYRVIPWLWMFVPAMVLSIWTILAAAIGVARFWRSTSRSSPVPVNFGAVLREATGALVDGVTLRNMRGGGPGCGYPQEEPSPDRRRLHGLVFWGFAAAFAATALAFVKQELLGELPPYPLLSAPVVLGTGGGIAMIAGAVGLLWLKDRGRAVTSDPAMLALDRTFLLVLVALSATGLALLAARETPLMGTLLALHLALVGAFFVTAPYGKFIHFVYRLAALLQDRIEERADASVATGVRSARAAAGAGGAAAESADPEMG